MFLRAIDQKMIHVSLQAPFREDWRKTVKNAIQSLLEVFQDVCRIFLQIGTTHGLVKLFELNP